MKYESYIDQIISENHIDLDDVLLSKNGNEVSIADFVQKTKKMEPWHRRLISDLTELQMEHGDIRKYMQKYTEEKMDSGFGFKE